MVQVVENNILEALYRYALTRNDIGEALVPTPLKMQDLADVVSGLHQRGYKVSAREVSLWERLHRHSVVNSVTNEKIQKCPARTLLVFTRQR